MFGRIRRVAVCLSGQARTWRTAKENILKYFDLTEHGCRVDFSYILGILINIEIKAIQYGCKE